MFRGLWRRRGGAWLCCRALFHTRISAQNALRAPRSRMTHTRGAVVISIASNADTPRQRVLAPAPHGCMLHTRLRWRDCGWWCWRSGRRSRRIRRCRRERRHMLYEATGVAASRSLPSCRLDRDVCAIPKCFGVLIARIGCDISPLKHTALALDIGRYFQHDVVDIIYSSAGRVLNDVAVCIRVWSRASASIVATSAVGPEGLGRRRCCVDVTDIGIGRGRPRASARSLALVAATCPRCAPHPHVVRNRIIIGC